MVLQIMTNNETETKKIAYVLAKLLQPGDVITLEGDLGAGKTTFTKGLAKGLDIKRNVTSPTFTILKQYEGIMPLYHIDAYRLEYSEEDIGFDEFIYGNGVTVIEWAQFIEEFLPESYMSVLITFIDETKREITVQVEEKKLNMLKQALESLKKDETE